MPERSRRERQQQQKERKGLHETSRVPLSHPKIEEQVHWSEEGAKGGGNTRRRKTLTRTQAPTQRERERNSVSRDCEQERVKEIERRRTDRQGERIWSRISCPSCLPADQLLPLFSSPDDHVAFVAGVLR